MGYYPVPGAAAAQGSLDRWLDFGDEQGTVLGWQVSQLPNARTERWGWVKLSESCCISSQEGRLPACLPLLSLSVGSSKIFQHMLNLRLANMLIKNQWSVLHI